MIYVLLIHTPIYIDNFKKFKFFTQWMMNLWSCRTRMFDLFRTILHIIYVTYTTKRNMRINIIVHADTSHKYKRVTLEHTNQHTYASYNFDPCATGVIVSYATQFISYESYYFFKSKTKRCVNVCSIKCILRKINASSQQCVKEDHTYSCTGCF